jgi:hypothetical protein
MLLYGNERDFSFRPDGGDATKSCKPKIASATTQLLSALDQTILVDDRPFSVFAEIQL